MASLIAALLAASLSADPSHLLLGKDASAVLTVAAPAGAKVTLSTSVGSVSEAKREGGVFHARFTPPAVKSPSVALVLAQVLDGSSRELRWLAIPLWGADTMEIETRPGSKVEADVAGHVVGPVTADKSGIARLPMVVPPGVEKATLHITDKLGNSADKPLDLEPPPFSRLRMAARDAQASVSAPLEVEIFVVRADGTPDDDAKIAVSASEGELELRRRIGHGVYLARFTTASKQGTAHLEAKVSGQPAELEVPLAAGKVALAQPFWRSALASERPWSFSVGLLGTGGSTFDGAGTLGGLFEAALRLEVLPVEALFDLDASWFSEVTQYGANAVNEQKAKARSRFGQLGLRFGAQVARGLDAHATLLFGLQSQVVGVTQLPSGVKSADDAWTPRFGLALGANLRLGPGRVFLQGQFDSSAPAIAGLAGSLGSAQLQLGYLVTVD
jgi:hypothetical protein